MKNALFNWAKIRYTIQIAGITLTFIIPLLYYVYWKGYELGFQEAIKFLMRS